MASFDRGVMVIKLYAFLHVSVEKLLIKYGKKKSEMDLATILE